MASTWTQTAARSVRQTAATTEAAPTLASEGVALSEVESVAVILRAPAGQTLSGTGTLLGYVYDGAAWVRWPRSDIDLADFAGLAESGDSLTVRSARDRFALVPSGVGLSAGASVTIDYKCVTRKGEAA